MMDHWDKMPLYEKKLHEQLATYTLAITDDLEGRSGVWGEHSYARERGTASHPHVCTLLFPRVQQTIQSSAANGLTLIDVDTPPPHPSVPPLDDLSEGEASEEIELGPEADQEETDWEQSILQTAVTNGQRRLARTVLTILTNMRLRRLAHERSRWHCMETTREAGTRLRLALAVNWSSAGWLHNTLLSFLPQPLRGLYEEVAGELRRTVPRLAARLAPRPPAPIQDPLDAVDTLCSSDSTPWFGWVSSGCEKLDARWRRRLSPLMYVRELSGPTHRIVPGPPDRWCAARAQAVRSALTQLIHEAGDRGVVVGGCGAGAALAAFVSGGGGAVGRGVRALILLAPPLLTAEGARDFNHLTAPMLLVAGGSAATCWRGAAHEIASAEARRLLLIGGADDALRLPRRHRLRLRVPQQALDSAIAEECARWAREVTEPQDNEAIQMIESIELSDHIPVQNSLGDTILTENSISDNGPSRRAAQSVSTATPVLNAASPHSTPPGNRSIEIVEGCVVSRVSGGTPLALGPPRRAELQPDDIMRLPIVFADDAAVSIDTNQVSPAPLLRRSQERKTKEERMTVRSGGSVGVGRGRTSGAARGAPVRYARVIVAKRGGSTPYVRRRGDPSGDTTTPLGHVTACQTAKVNREEAAGRVRRTWDGARGTAVALQASTAAGCEPATTAARLCPRSVLCERRPRPGTARHHTPLGCDSAGLLLKRYRSRVTSRCISNHENTFVSGRARTRLQLTRSIRARSERTREERYSLMSATM
ncbi:unnamed protein product [Leptosia nina]|uniref:KAT8 regulatory NSL complex subunit 3 n=1 Tax=Leptosia nina TaxID=320188 RepID=A0AAV1J2J2_9NEOP